jgi:hypothetical protein
MSDWKQRLKQILEPVLREKDPRPKISAYHNMPYAIFRYPPEDEFSVRSEISMLRTRLEQAGKRVSIVSLADCLAEALEREGLTVEEIKSAEEITGTDTMADTFHQILSEYQPLDDLVAEQMPQDPDPLSDVVFITRAGSRF